MKKILIFNGHPNTGSFCHSLALAYQKGAGEGAAEIQQISLDSLEFNPNLKFGYSKISELEPALIEAQNKIKWADHIVFVYPNWWGGMPAVMKGFFDRTFLPGFAFKYRKDSPLPEKLLSGKTADIIVTMDTPPVFYKWFLGNVGVRQLKKNILDFSGIKTKHVYYYGPVRNSTQEKREGWINTAETAGRLTAK